MACDEIAYIAAHTFVRKLGFECVAKAMKNFVLTQNFEAW